MMTKCNWCGNEVEESMVAHQSAPPVEDICLYCLCKSHPNLKAHLATDSLAKVEERETSELKSLEVGY